MELYWHISDSAIKTGLSMFHTEFKDPLLLSKLRNPHGLSAEEMKATRLLAADELEWLRTAYDGLREDMGPMEYDNGRA